MMEERHIIAVIVCPSCSRARKNADNSSILVWSNFEIGDLDLWRGEAYGKFFEFLDEKGGFYYEVRTAFHRTSLHHLICII
jgi:hypothetical protein